MDIEQLKQELVRDIKLLAEDIAKSETFVGLLSNEIKFRSLHEKFVNLKFLERKNLGLEIFDQPIPTQEEKEEIFSTSEDRYEDEKIVEFNFKKETEKNDKTEKEKSSTKDENIISANEILQQSEGKFIDSQFETEVKDQAENIETEDNSVELDDFSDLLPKKNIPEVQIDFNDRIAFLNQLFDGDDESMGLVINTLNHIDSLSESNDYLSDLKSEMDWEGQDEYFERLQELIEKRFD